MRIFSWIWDALFSWPSDSSSELADDSGRVKKSLSIKCILPLVHELDVVIT